MKKKIYKYKDREFIGIFEFLKKEVFTHENLIRGLGVFLIWFGYNAPKLLVPIPFIDKSYEENILFIVLGSFVTITGPYIKTVVYAKFGVKE